MKLPCLWLKAISERHWSSTGKTSALTMMILHMTSLVTIIASFLKCDSNFHFNLKQKIWYISASRSKSVLSFTVVCYIRIKMAVVVDKLAISLNGDYCGRARIAVFIHINTDFIFKRDFSPGACKNKCQNCRFKEKRMATMPPHLACSQFDNYSDLSNFIELLIMQ